MSYSMLGRGKNHQDEHLSPATLPGITKTPDYLKMILTSRVYDVAIETPLAQAKNLSTRLGVNILRIHSSTYLHIEYIILIQVKREDLQPVFSFKIRGAYNKISNLSREDQQKGVIAVSAGNHAQGVAMAAKKLGISATIVMPLCTPSIKYSNVQNLGANVILHGQDFDEAKAECVRLVDELGLVNIPPYDDPFIIAGQGTVALEIMKQAQRWKLDNGSSDDDGEAVDAIFCAVGGGGLISGISAYIKRIYPNVKLIGVETYDANAMYQSLKAGKRVKLEQVGLFAEGAAVGMVGEETFRVCLGSEEQPGVDEIVLVSNDEICAAIKDIFNDTRTVMETAGALGVAGLKKYLTEKGVEKGTFVAVTSGANMNFDRLRFVSERASLGEEKEAMISVVIPERPGSFMKLYEQIYPRNVTEFSYRFCDKNSANIFVSFEVKDRQQELNVILQNLSAKGFVGRDLSQNELAKSHARYMVGGKVKLLNERLFQFSFPERPGALKKFLSGLASDWNVSMFHYRNYGADVGKVLVGLQVPLDSQESFEEFLRELNYPYREETQNPIYAQFFSA